MTEQERVKLKYKKKLFVDLSGIGDSVSEQVVTDTEKICLMIKKKGQINQTAEKITDHEVREVRGNVKCISEKRDVKYI